MTDKHSEQILQDLYNQRKNQNTMPSQVKDKVMQHARSQRSSPWRWFNWQSGFAIIAIVTMFGFVNNHPDYVDRPSYSVNQSVNEYNQIVFRLDVEAIDEEKRNKGPKIKQDAHYDAFIASLQQLENQRNLKGTVVQVDDKLAVEVCDVGLIEVSNQIMRQLGLRQPVSSFDQGQPIMLVVDSRGVITNIVRGGSVNACS